MDVRQLEHFLAVIETGSLNRASEIASVSQQGMSASIKALESSLNSVLLERGRFGARPTRAGEALARHARRIVGQMRLAKAEVLALETAETGLATIGVGTFFAQRIVPRAIALLAKTRPGILVRSIEAPTDQIIKMLLNGEIDFGVSTPSAMIDIDPVIVAETLFEDFDAPLVGRDHPVLAKPELTLADLQPYPWISSSSMRGEHDRVINAFITSGLMPPERFVFTDSLAIVRELLSAGDYVHVSGRWHFNHSLTGYCAVPIILPQFGNRRIGIRTMRKGGTMPPPSRALMEAVMKVIRTSDINP